MTKSVRHRKCCTTAELCCPLAFSVYQNEEKVKLVIFMAHFSPKVTGSLNIPSKRWFRQFLTINFSILWMVKLKISTKKMSGYASSLFWYTVQACGQQGSAVGQFSLCLTNFVIGGNSLYLFWGYICILKQMINFKKFVVKMSYDKSILG